MRWTLGIRGPAGPEVMTLGCPPGRPQLSSSAGRSSPRRRATAAPSGRTPTWPLLGARGELAHAAIAGAADPAGGRGCVQPRGRGDRRGGAAAGGIAHRGPAQDRRGRGGPDPAVAAVRAAERGRGRPGRPPLADGRRRPGPQRLHGAAGPRRAHRRGVDPGPAGGLLRDHHRLHRVPQRLPGCSADGGRPRRPVPRQRPLPDRPDRRRHPGRAAPRRAPVRSRRGGAVRARRGQLRGLGGAAGHPAGPAATRTGRGPVHHLGRHR